MCGFLPKALCYKQKENYFHKAEVLWDDLAFLLFKKNLCRRIDSEKVDIFLCSCVCVCVVEDVEMCVGGWYDLSESSCLSNIYNSLDSFLNWVWWNLQLLSQSLSNSKETKHLEHKNGKPATGANPSLHIINHVRALQLS